MKDFSVGEAISNAWEVFKRNWVLFVGLAVISAVISGIASSIDRSLGISNFGIFGFLAATFIAMGAANVALKSIKGETAEFADFFTVYPLFLVFLISNFLFSVIVSIGFILIIIPGIYLAVRLQFFGYYIVDKNASGTEAVTESLRNSWELTRGITLKVFVLDLAFLGLIILGAIPIGLGLLIVFPLITLASAYVYLKLAGAEASPVKEPEPVGTPGAHA
ncbi:MAG TPA: DUF975 family protein [Candidatus Aquicultor sp.]|jgi:uncharacterized membrane protein